MTSTVVAPLVADPLVDHEPPKVAHIVARENDADADTLVTTAYIEGTPLEALCGEVFPVTKSAKPGSPVCPDCKRIYATLKKA